MTLSVEILTCLGLNPPTVSIDPSLLFHTVRIHMDILQGKVFATLDSYVSKVNFAMLGNSVWETKGFRGVKRYIDQL